jgi:hypothetical protein
MSLYGINLDQVGASPPKAAERAPGAELEQAPSDRRPHVAQCGQLTQMSIGGHGPTVRPRLPAVLEESDT